MMEEGDLFLIFVNIVFIVCELAAFTHCFRHQPLSTVSLLNVVMQCGARGRGRGTSHQLQMRSVAVAMMMKM